MGIFSEDGKEFYRRQLKSVQQSIEWEKDQIVQERIRIANNKKNQSVVKSAKMVIESRKKNIEQKKRQAAIIRDCIKRAK